jgi:monofunctional chorismate mutase
VCEHLHLPLQSGSDRVLAAMHRGYTAERYLERLAAARPPSRPGRHHRHHRRLPRRDRRRLRAHPRGGAEAEYDSAYTFIFSPRARAPRRPRWTDHFVAPEVAAERFERLRVVVERSALARHEARVGRVEEVSSRGRARRTPRCSPGAPARTSSCTSALVHLLAERFKITKAVGRYKAQADLPAADERREQVQIERLRALAEQSGLDPAFTEQFLRFIVAEVIHHHQRIAEGEQL